MRTRRDHEYGESGTGTAKQRQTGSQFDALACASREQNFMCCFSSTAKDFVYHRAVLNVATETICERLLREVQEPVEPSAVKPERKKPANSRRKLPTADGHVLVRPTPDQYRYINALGIYPVESVARSKAKITLRQVKRWRKQEWFVEAEAEVADLASRARESQEERWLRIHGDGWKMKFLQALKETLNKAVIV